MDDRGRAQRLPALGRHGEGWFAGQVVLMAAVAMAGLLGSAVGDPARDVTVFLGMALIAIAGVVGLRAMSDLRGSFTPLPHPVEGGALVEQGVYATVRHPMYLAVVTGALGWSLLCGSPAALVATAVLFAFFDLKSRREEAWLVEAYPDYGEYRRRTRRILPGLY